MRISDWSSDVCSSDLGGVEFDHHRAVRRADGEHVARAGNALELGFQGMRDLREFPRTTLRIVRPQRQRHHRYVVDAFWLDDRLADTDSLRHPVLVGRSEEHTSELQSLMRISYAVFCL